MKKLFTTRYGSFLYGTHTATSDVDLKHVVLPELNDLLVGKRVQNIVNKTNNEKNTRNSIDDVDEEFIPIQVFAYDFLGGQTYALELAYAVEFTDANQVIHDEFFRGFCRELRNGFLTSNMTALIGYAVNQASLYSFKGERLNAVRKAHDLYMNFKNSYPAESKPLNCTSNFILEAKAIEDEFPKYFSVTEYAVDNKGTMRPCVKLLEKVLPFTSTFETSLSVIDSHLKKYGSRAEAASIDNVDWKATMHALRVVNEGISLLKNKTLSFPFEPNYVELLLKIKHGKIMYDEVISMINEQLEELKTLETSSTLPKKSPEMVAQMDFFLAEWMRHFYNLPWSVS